MSAVNAIDLWLAIEPLARPDNVPQCRSECRKRHLSRQAGSVLLCVA